MSDSFNSQRQCMYEVKAGLYHDWLLEYILKCTPTVAADAYSSQHFNIYYTSMLKADSHTVIAEQYPVVY